MPTRAISSDSSSRPATARTWTQPDDTDPETTALQIRRNVLGEILVTQTRMLGGSLTREWRPPPEDAPPESQLLYANYCATRNEIMTQFEDSLSYIPLPPCP